MFENFKKSSSKGRTSYNNSVIQSIVTLAVAEVEGVAPDGIVSSDAKKNAEKFLQKIKIDIDENNIFVDLSIYIYQGYAVPDVAFKVQETVKNGIENMTTFKLTAVDVRVLGVIAKPEVK